MTLHHHERRVAESLTTSRPKEGALKSSNRAQYTQNTERERSETAETCLREQQDYPAFLTQIIANRSCRRSRVRVRHWKTESEIHAHHDVRNI